MRNGSVGKRLGERIAESNLRAGRQRKGNRKLSPLTHGFESTERTHIRRRTESPIALLVEDKFELEQGLGTPDCIVFNRTVVSKHVTQEALEGKELDKSGRKVVLGQPLEMQPVISA